SVWIDINADGAASESEKFTSGTNHVTIPADAEIGKTVATVTFSDGTSITFNVAIVEKITKERTVTAIAGANGTVAIEGTDKLSVTNKEAVKITATPNTGYNFNNWSDAKGKVVSNSNPFIYYGKESAEFTANFIENKWGVIDGKTSSYGDIASYKQFVHNIRFAYYNRPAETIYETTTTPEYLFNTIQKIITVPQGASFDIEYDNGGNDGLKYCYMRAFIDLNGDGDFDDNGELLKSTGTEGAQNTAVCSGKINVLLPYDMPLGMTHMRLRFDGAWDNNSKPSAKGAKDASIRPVYEIVINVTEFSQTASHITVNGNNSEWGDVAVWTDETPDGSTRNEWDVTKGVEFSIKAEPKNGAEFLCWKDRYGRVLTTEPEHTMYAREDATYTAIFNKGESRKELGTLIANAENLIKCIGTIEPLGKMTKLTLQTTDSNKAYYLWSNAADPQEGNISYLVDGIKNDANRFFHTNWHNAATSEGYHYIEVDLGEENILSTFWFYYNTRNTTSGSDYPDAVTVMLSKDKQNYENIYTVSEGLPQKPSSDYNSGQFGSNKEYRYIRFKITAERTYWHMGEFEIYAISSKATINTEYSTVKAEDAEALYDLMVIAKGVYDNSIDNSELDAMYKRL
ncbi:MAG: hypothetical protein J6U89_04850, partial [Bacteroidaceae bacterium]|nr:hypothetical protein [Bacteroidaceae bacterium]